ncbi:hypothetical protein [Flavonifractor sp. An10]|uniref:hypothetical protein n=1 Tax=Flavonifractor sp. An10 TaxID=1965537 RepID=UPI001140DF79|nr:hypothetical protein [Flavonifractor sp. An10]
MTTIQTYVPSPPTPGLATIYIVRVQETDDSILLYYDIALGPSAGYAYCLYQVTGFWPLCWRITKKSAGEFVRCCALKAIQRNRRNVKDLLESADSSLVVYLDCADDSNSDSIHICRSYPLDISKINPDDIRINGTVSWAEGSPENIRANLMAAYNPNLPLLLISKEEKASPMIDWAAKHHVILLPSKMDSGDYQMLDGKYIVDRKSDLLELFNDFCMPDNRRRYENAAVRAKGQRKKLVYVVGTNDVTDIDSLEGWSAPIPGKNKIADGNSLAAHLRRYQMTFPHISFVFCPSDTLCKTIFEQANGKA